MTSSASQTPSTVPALESSSEHKHLGWALVVICAAQLMVVLDGTIANIALPHIGHDLNISQANLTWIVTGYALAFGGLLLLGGRLGDLYGRRTVFAIGLTVFAGASLLGGFAQNEAMLLSSRALQGLGAAMASPAALALITTTFPAGPARNRAFGFYAMMSGIGAAIGLILGGWLTSLNSVGGIDVEGWRLTFLINVPIGLGAAFAAVRVLGQSERHSGWLDVPGAVIGTSGLLSLVFGLSRAGEADYGWGNGQTITALAIGVLLLTTFLIVETRQEHPLLPLRIFANRTRAISFIAFMIAPAAMFSMFYFLSLTIQQVMGYSSIRTGFAFLPFSFGMVAGATTSSKLISKVPPRFLAGPGTVIAAASLFMLSRIPLDDSTSNVLHSLASGVAPGSEVNYWIHVFPYVFTMSLGMGLTFVTLTLTAVHGVRAEDSGIGSGVLNTMQQVGGALGLATLSTVALHFLNDRAASAAPALAAGLAKAGVDPHALIPGTGQSYLAAATFQASFPTGAIHAMTVAAALMVCGSLVIWTLLDVKHTELAASAPEGAAAH